MKAPLHICISVRVVLALILTLCYSQVHAQSVLVSIPLDSSLATCMVSMPTVSAPGNFVMPASPQPASLHSCGSGRLIAYFEDLDPSTGKGFDDASFGLQRRNRVCDVLSYIESVVDIDASVTPANPLIIKFDKYTTTTPSTFVPANLKAIVRPNYPTVTPGFYNSYMGEAMIHGGTNLGYYHCGNINVNWNYQYAYGATVGGCEEDFFSLILHEVTHLMGFCSAMSKDLTAAPQVINLNLGPATFTTFDQHFLYYYNGSSLQQIVDNSNPLSPALFVPAATLLTSMDDVWLNGDDLSSTRTNQPIEDMHNIGPGVNMSYSHLVEDFKHRTRESPGFAPAYVMDWRQRPGYLRRAYSLQELRILDKLGFKHHPLYADWAKVSNMPPYTLGAVVDPANVQNDQLAQTPPAGNGDLYITTTSCHAVTVNLNGMTGGTRSGIISGWNPLTNLAISHSLGLADPDPTPISVYQNKLWPITGCSDNLGLAATPPLQLAGNIITFTPRRGFAGRARFGFHLGDGTERGSFIVVTVDVTKDRACFGPVPDLCNLVINGDFEEGSQFNHYDFTTGLYDMPCTTDSTNYMMNYVGNMLQNEQVLSDGVETLHATIVDVYTPTYCFGPCLSYYTGTPFTFPFAGIPASSTGHFPAPPVLATPNKRYLFYDHLAAHSDRNLSLHDEMLPGAEYEINFDYNFGYLGGAPAPTFPPAGEDLNLYFNSTLNLGYIIYSTAIAGYLVTNAPASIPKIKYASGIGWQPYHGLFTYGGAAGNKFMRIVYSPNTAGTAQGFMTDNVVLHRIIHPVITSSSTVTPATLTATVAGGHIASWQWYDASHIPIPGATTNVLIVKAYGTYCVKAIDSNGCEGSACYTLEVPCPSFVAALTPGSTVQTLSGTLSTSLIPGAAYYVPGTLNIGSGASVTFSYNYILMAPNSSIYINNGTSLTISKSHLATCPDSAHMWKGIILGADGGSSIKVTGSSLIEDALKAIDGTNIGSGGGSKYIIETDDAVFNRNRVAIYIDNVAPSKSYGFRFVNTVFTSRDIASNFVTWSDPGKLKSPQTPLPAAYRPPYLLDNVSLYPLKNCKDGNIAYSGILLDKAGRTTFTPGPNFFGIAVGDESKQSYRNLFDYMRAGIESHNSNLYVQNGTFMNMIISPINRIPLKNSAGGSGVYADATTYTTEVNVTTGNNSTERNEFYENATSVECIDNYQVIINRCYITSSNLAAAEVAPWSGYHGIYMRSTWYGLMQAADNIVDNMLYGIYAGSFANPAYFTPGNIYILRNQLHVPTAAPGAAVHNKNQGIRAENLLNSPNKLITTSSNPWLLISENILSGVYKGIDVNGFQDRPAFTEGNTVILQPALNGLTQTGISQSNNAGNFVRYNKISSANKDNDAAQAVKIATCISPVVTCNDEHHIGRGFEFYMSNAGAVWLNNDMTSNAKGFVLNNSILGPQAVTGTGCNNRWNGNPAGWTGAWHTYSYDMNPGNSKLFIKYGASPDLVPSNNGLFTGFIAYSSVSLPTAISVYTSCERFQGPVIVSFRLAMHERIAQDSIIYGSDEDRNKWLSQMQLYRAVAQDDTLRDSSAILQSFLVTAAGSRYAWLAQIEDSLAGGNDAAAASLLSAPPPPANGIPGPYDVMIHDGPAGNTIVANYVSFFNLYLAWRQGGLSSADSIALTGLAGLCPRVHGAVIYQARILLGLITRDHPVYNDDCPDGGAGGGARKMWPAAAGVQVYSLSPNPNDGNIHLWQAIGDENPVKVTVYNTLGAIVYSSALTFRGNAAAMDLSNIAPGLYNIVLHDNAGAASTLKFVKK